jgi:hypothetical protein
MKSQMEQNGYEWTKGALTQLAMSIGCGCIFVLIFFMCRNTFGLGLDDSDKDGWHRSGLTIYTDYKTGTQYLSDGNGGLIQRAK